MTPNCLNRQILNKIVYLMPINKKQKCEGDDDNENDSDDANGQKPKEISTPLWKYVTRLGGGKGGGTTKFIFSHSHKTYTCSYTHVRKHLCGMKVRLQESKPVRMCWSKIETNTRRKRRQHKTNPKNQGLNLRPQAHIKCLVVDPHPPCQWILAYAFKAQNNIRFP